MHDFEVVIGKTDGGKHDRGKHTDPDKWIAQIGPQECRNHDADGNQQTAHGGRACLFMVSLRSLFSDVLPDLKFTQAPNDNRANDQGCEKRGQTGESGTEREIAEDSEWRKIMEQLQI